MTGLSHFIILDRASGTFFDADNAFLIDTRRLSPEELKLFNEETDSYRAQVAFEQGHDLEDLIDPSNLTYNN